MSILCFVGNNFISFEDNLEPPRIYNLKDNIIIHVFSWEEYNKLLDLFQDPLPVETHLF